VEYKTPTKPNAYVKKALKRICHKYNLDDQADVSIEHIVGKRISVKWVQFGGEWFEGTVVAHEGRGKFWIKYRELTV